MKQAQIFHQYLWIINTLRTYHKQTFDELNQKWIDDRVAEGNRLQRSSFNRHREAILDMFGIIIDCEPKTYQYYISNAEALKCNKNAPKSRKTLQILSLIEKNMYLCSGNAAKAIKQETLNKHCSPFAISVNIMNNK